jgi:CO/xanthine dehydrogenase Mo-binding subunit
MLRRGLRAVKIEMEPLPAILDPLAPLTPELIQYGSDNIFKRIDIRKGDPRSVFSHAAHVVEGEYRTGAQEHVYLETQGVIAYREDGRITVKASCQCPYYVLDALKFAFGRPAEEFRVVQTPVGGGFGGKEEYPSVLAVHAAVLSEKCGAPVKIIYDRQEDMAVTTKRHPSVVRHRTAFDREARLLGMEIEIVMDGGAYVTLSPVVLSRGAIHAAGPYHCDHVHIHAEARLTNSPPYGAFRGFGAPQTLYAVERHMDEAARQIGIDPIELRRRNLLRAGQSTATGQEFRDKVDLVQLMERACAEIQFDERRKAHAAFNSTHPHLRRGVGLATFFHGAGFTGAGEVYLASQVWAEGRPDGSVEVLTAQTDMGQGTSTILAQIAAEALGYPESEVRVAQPDTSRVPNSGPTVASRTAMVVGKLVHGACRDLALQLGNKDLAGSALRDAIRAWYKDAPDGTLRGAARYERPPEIEWDDKAYRGDAYATYSWATYAADVEVDLRTYATRVTDFVAVQEVGRVLNPTLARGQIQGGVVQGIGWALYEEVVLKDGVMRNCQMTNYIIPGSGDLPPIRVIFAEQPTVYGPGGAKGIGELPMDGPAPAIVNAVCAAVGASVRDIPMTPERLMESLEGARSA